MRNQGDVRNLYFRTFTKNINGLKCLNFEIPASPNITNRFTMLIMSTIP